MSQVIAPPSIPTIEQFTESATKAVASVEVIDRTPAALRDAILRAAGDATRILYAPPHDLPASIVRGLRNRPAGAWLTPLPTRWSTPLRV